MNAGGLPTTPAPAHGQAAIKDRRRPVFGARVRGALVLERRRLMRDRTPHHRKTGFERDQKAAISLAALSAAS